MPEINGQIEDSLKDQGATTGARSPLAWFALVVVLLIIISLYLPVRHFTFLNWDDQLLVVDNSRVQVEGAADVQALFDPRDVVRRGAENYLPVRDLSYALDFSLAGLSPRFFHLSNLFWHLFNVFFLWLILRLILPIRPIFCAGLVLFWGLHPSLVESTAWVSGRKEILVTFFGLTAFYLFLLAAKEQVKSWPALVVAVFACVAAILTKQTGLGFILLLFVLPFTAEFYKWRSWRVILAVLIPIAIGLFFLNRWVQAHVPFELYATGVLEGSLFRHYLLWLQLPLRYLHLSLIPLGLNARHAPYFFSVISWQALLFSLSFLILAGGAVLLWAKSRSSRLGLAWLVCLMLPTANLIPIPNFIAERYLYTPLIGLVLIAAALARDLKLTKSARIAASVFGCAYLLFLGGLTSCRILVWQSDLSLWQADTKGGHAVSFVWANLGMAYHRGAQCEKALEAFKRALAIKADEAVALRGRVLTLKCLKRFDQLPRAIEQMLAQTEKSGLPAALVTAATLAGEAREFLLAEKLLKRAKRLKPTDANIDYNLAVNLANQQKLETALQLVKKARLLHSKHPELKKLEERLISELERPAGR